MSEHCSNVIVTTRQETAADHEAVLEMVRDAFWNMYGPGCDEHYLVHNMHSHKDTIPELCLVAVDDNNKILGFIGGTRASVVGRDAATEVVTLAPLAVSRACHSKGVGSMLVEAFVDKCKTKKCPCIVILGYPSYYDRFGAVNAHTFGIHMPNKSQPLGLQVIPLVDNSSEQALPSGAYVESTVFQGLEPEAIEAFEKEKSLPYKEKKEGTKSQKMFAMIIKLAYDDEVPPEFDPKACNDTS